LSVAGKGKVVLFGGYDGEKFLNDVYVYSGIHPDSPPSHFLELLVPPKSLFVDAFGWGGGAESGWEKPTVQGTCPSPRSQHSSVMVDQKMVVFGGWDGFNVLSDLHVLDTGSPPPLQNHHKGLWPMGHLLNFWPQATWKWEKVKTSGCMPQARYGHASVLLRHALPNEESP